MRLSKSSPNALAEIAGDEGKDRDHFRAARPIGLRRFRGQ